jgi:hypothetical protein
MKTAMTQFLEWLENSSNVKDDILNWGIVKENALEKEKEQIIDAHLNGQQDHHFSLESRMAESEDFYNQTYNQNK